MGHVQKKLSDPDDLESGVVGGMTQGKVGKANSTNRFHAQGRWLAIQEGAKQAQLLHFQSGQEAGNQIIKKINTLF